MISKDIFDFIYMSMYESGFYYDEYEKMNVINFLKMFLDKYDFENFVENHNIKESEYKKYFKSDVKYHNKERHKRIKQMYKTQRGDKNES